MPSEAFGIMIDLGDKLADLVRDHVEWSRATFGIDEVRGPIGPLKHLEKEAGEAQKAYLEFSRFASMEDSVAAQSAEKDFKDELADCFLLLLDASRRSGVKIMQLIEAAQAKLEVNKKREWPKAGVDDAVEHIKES